MTNKVTIEQLLPLMTAAFERDSEFEIPITGQSMLPLLVQGRDKVYLKKPPEHLQNGDIPLYRRDDGAFVLHRVVGENDKGYILCGDNQTALEYGITDSHIVGLVCAIVKDGKIIDVETDSEYLKYKKKYTNNIKTRYPVRRAKALAYRVYKKMRGR